MRLHLGALLVVAGVAVAAAEQGTSVQPTPAVGRPSAESAGAPTKPRATTSGLVTGRVIDGETGAPIAAATVSVLAAGAQPSGRTPRVLTDNAGRFFFDEVGAGSFPLTAAKPGWIPGELGRGRPGGAAVRLEMAVGGHQSDVTIRLWRYGVISGRVLDEAGEPLIGVDVRVFQRTFVAGHPRWGYTTRAITDDRGMYRVSTLEPGEYVVVVPTAVTSEPTTLRGRQEDQSLFLRTMTGLAGAPMSVGTEATLPIPGRQTLVTSIFPIDRSPVAEGDWLTYPTTLAPSATLATEATVVLVRSGAEQSNVDITMRPARSYQVSGVIMDLDGKPAAFHAVHLIAANTADNPLFDVSTAVSDSTGAFTFYGVPPGDYVARAVRIPPPGSQRSIATCGGTGAISFVCVVSEGPSGGEPSLDPLAYGNVDLTVSNKHVAGVHLELRPGARVSGTVEFVGASTTPAQRATTRVVLEPADGRSSTAPGGIDPTAVSALGADGAFHSASTSPGRYLLRVTRLPEGWTLQSATYRGRDIANMSFDLNNDMSGVMVTVVDRADTVNGSVARAGTERDAALVVLLFPADRSGWVDYGRTSRQVQSVGVLGDRYTLPAPPPGDYLMIALRDAQATDWQNPAVLEKIALQADRVHVPEDQSVTRALTVRSLR